jgi:hypothetical protein
VSCVPYDASFSGLSFFIAPSVFHNIYLFCVSQDSGQINVIEYRKGNEKEQSREIGIIGYKGHRTINVREYPRGNKIGQFRETGNIGYTRHRKNKC